jgi:hypothetical protein
MLVGQVPAGGPDATPRKHPGYSLPGTSRAQRPASLVVTEPGEVNRAGGVQGVAHFEHGRDRNLLIGGDNFVNMPPDRTSTTTLKPGQPLLRRVKIL